MDALMKLSRDVQIILGGALLYVIFSFFDWQQVSGFGITYGRSEWTGIGVLAALLGIVLLAWELARAFNIQIPLGGSLTPGLVSAALALLLVVFTVITFLTHGTARHWPSWIGLILSIVIAGFAFKRAQGEGVEMPKMPTNMGSMGGGGTAGGSSGGGPSTDASPPTDSSADA
jgi:hypothetical protein